jgi:hypothetical protein
MKRIRSDAEKSILLSTFLLEKPLGYYEVVGSQSVDLRRERLLDQEAVERAGILVQFQTCGRRDRDNDATIRWHIEATPFRRRIRYLRSIRFRTLDKIWRERPRSRLALYRPSCPAVSHTRRSDVRTTQPAPLVSVDFSSPLQKTRRSTLMIFATNSLLRRRCGRSDKPEWARSPLGYRPTV